MYLLTVLKRLAVEDDGPTAIEYAVLGASIIAVCAFSVGLIGQRTNELMDPNGQLTGALTHSSGS